jgi:hypothetical protein
MNTDKYLYSVFCSFNIKTLNFDVALVRLSRPILFSQAIRPICLQSQGETQLNGQTAVVVGWGKK